MFFVTLICFHVSEAGNKGKLRTMTRHRYSGRLEQRTDRLFYCMTVDHEEQQICYSIQDSILVGHYPM